MTQRRDEAFGNYPLTPHGQPAIDGRDPATSIAREVVGNIYAAEALWLARINPQAVASSLSGARRVRLLEAIRSVLDKAQRSSGRYRDDGVGRFEVYDREGLPCTRCGHRIRRIAQGGRSTYFCPHCQRR